MNTQRAVTYGCIETKGDEGIPSTSLENSRFNERANSLGTEEDLDAFFDGVFDSNDYTDVPCPSMRVIPSGPGGKPTTGDKVELFFRNLFAPLVCRKPKTA